MRKLLFTLVCLLAMTAAGSGLEAQEITITLLPGCTWIGYPNAETMDIATALGEFVPMEGDVIKSQYSQTVYSNGRWRGRLQQFTPGLGYMYYSMRGEPVTLVFGGSTPQAQVHVTTSEPLLVTAVSAMCGGEVTTTDGTYIIVKGLCWATHENPMTNDSCQEMGSGEGSFTVSMSGLNMGTTYHVRAYAVTSDGTVYGDQKAFTTRDGIPEVSTAEAGDVTANSATCGGMVTDDGGLGITARGVCWGTGHNPTVSDSHTTDGTGTGSFVSSLTGLTASTTYYVRAYATNSYVTVYGSEVSFTTESEGGGGDHEYVSLGLPSGLLWATCNVGADTPEDYGDYFAWGETQPKQTYTWESYIFAEGTSLEDPQLTKYCNNSSYGYNGFTDNLTTLLPEDDAATVNWGGDWRMPTNEEFQELLDNTTCTWTTQNGVNGRLFTAPNGNSLFLPAAGYYYDSSLNTADSYGNYWSGSLDTGIPSGAWYFFLHSGGYGMFSGPRYCGLSVRAVRSLPEGMSFINAVAYPLEGGSVSGSGTYQEGSECTLNAIPNQDYVFINWTENDEVVSTNATYTFTVNGNRSLVANFDFIGDHVYVDLGLPSGLLWATCNMGADNPEDYGDYFAWGETQPKDTYGWNTYQYCMDYSSTLTKYCSNSSYGYNGFTDNLTILLPEDDAATANWGGDWRMPTTEEFQELYNNTTVTWTQQNGVNGHLFTASNGNSLFLPTAGGRSGSSLCYAGSGRYWSSSLNTDTPSNAWYFYFDDFGNGYGMLNNGPRDCGLSVRAVRSPQTEHAYVDLGLPSGTLWATCNVGAETPEDYGDYFAWGETQPKDTYNWSTYQYCMGSDNTLTKYCNDASYGYNGFTDNLTTLLPEDDAATANWGSGWRMPTQKEWYELLNNTTCTWTTQNGVNGRLFTASNGNSLFLPAGGDRWESELEDAGSWGYYWSSSLSTGYPNDAWYFRFNSDNYGMNYYRYRDFGQSVRPVRTTQN